MGRDFRSAGPVQSRDDSLWALLVRTGPPCGPGAVAHLVTLLVLLSVFPNSEHWWSSEHKIELSIVKKI
jgi:hypothetical protein